MQFIHFHFVAVLCLTAATESIAETFPTRSTATAEKNNENDDDKNNEDDDHNDDDEPKLGT